MNPDEYDINSMFRVLPSVQHTMQAKILNIIEERAIPPSIHVDYGNYLSEIDSNLSYQNSKLGSDVKYGESFQLYQNSTKRYL